VHTRCNQLDLPFANITRIQLNSNLLTRDPGSVITVDTDYVEQLTTKVVNYIRFETAQTKKRLFETAHHIVDAV
jgi:hypothetical protein